MKVIIITVLIAFLLATLIACNEDKRDYLITATSSQIAVDGGMEILNERGSAMDAALSVALAEIAATGGKYISYAGMLSLLYFEAETGTIQNMNAAFNTLENEVDPTTIPDASYRSAKERKIVGRRTILVPDFMKCVEEAYNPSVQYLLSSHCYPKDFQVVIILYRLVYQSA